MYQSMYQLSLLSFYLSGRSQGKIFRKNATEETNRNAIISVYACPRQRATRDILGGCVCLCVCVRVHGDIGRWKGGELAIDLGVDGTGKRLPREG